MPRKYVRRRRPMFKRKRRMATGAKTLAVRALRKVNQITRSTELKKSDPTTFHSATSIAHTGMIVPCTSVAQNASSTGRVGSEISVKYINIDGVVTLGSGQSSNIVRFILFLDKQEVPSASPAVTAILEPGVVGTGAAPFAKLNRAETGRFQVLRSFRVFVNTERRQAPVKILKKFYNHIQKYNGGPTDNVRGTVWLLIISDVLNQEPTFQGTIRNSFTDI